MEFLCDMGVSMQVVQWLRDQGHDATHLSEENLQRLPNGEIFAKAVSEGRIVVTFDLDFGEIAAMAGGQVASVIVFRLRNTRADHVIQRLGAVLDRAVEALQSGAIVMVEESRLRIRLLPIGRK
jgi:predicted nuclease of predicted toxin-antitoxin system